MGLIFLEALAAGGLFIVIVWWTMFSGRRKGELHAPDDDAAGAAAAPDGKPLADPEGPGDGLPADLQRTRREP